VSLDCDTTRALRTTGELVSLIRAISTASAHDETAWLELKSTLDLADKGARFAIAKALLGFANRPVEMAALHCEGCAYLIVGADHDGIHGVTPVDLAQLEQGLTTYLGTGEAAPRWSCRYVDVDGAMVFVATVEPPRLGDRAKTLKKAFGNFAAGARSTTTTPRHVTPG
jgi:hypothetical protein